MAKDDSWNWDRYRPWLQILARQAIPPAMQARCDASDVVQQTLAEAWRSKEHCRGDDEEGRQKWLRGILANVVAGQQRHHLGTAARTVDREQKVQDSLLMTSRILQQFADKHPSPSALVQKEEQTLLVASALTALSDEHREVLILRHFDELSHDEIGERTGRSSAAARMLWIRALSSLKKTLGDTDQSAE